MDRFHDEANPASELGDVLFVGKVKVSEISDELGVEPIVYGLTFEGISVDSGEDKPVKITMAMASRPAGRLSAVLLRGASLACDEDFSASWLVSVSESADESRQFLSQHLGHEENDGPEA